MAAWEPWCAAQCIADPEQFFSHPSYIAEVLTRSPAARSGPTHTSAGEPEAMWRLVVAEDADEYLRSSARRDSGAALGRLLNLADGVLGQGFNTLILLTTNESRLHPAVVRPGRSLARIEFDRFTPTESRNWLPAAAPAPTEPKSLAELFELSGTITRIDDRVRAQSASTGQYL